jgi:hypothetical protein
MNAASSSGGALRPFRHADDFLGGGAVVGDHSEAGGHRLNGHVAPGLGQAGKQEHVAGAVVRGQRLADLRAAVNGVGAPGLPERALGAITHQHQTRGGMGRTHGIEGAEYQFQIFFGRQAPHIQCHRLVLAHAPARAQRRIAAAGMKPLGVDPAPDDLDVLVTKAEQLAADALGRHQGDGGLVMELAQVGDDGAAQQAEAVVAAVAVEIGVEVARHRQPQLVGRRQRRPAERAFGGNLHHIRALLGPQLGQRSLRR